MKQINLKKLVARIQERASRDPLKFELAPYRVWRIIVICFLGAFVASALFGAYLFVGVRNENLFNSEEKKAPGVVLDTAKLSLVVKQFDDKQKALEMLKGGEPVQVDPSL